MTRTVVALFVALAVCTPALAQFETASVVGTVRDNSGAVVSGATVTLTNIETGVSSTKATDDQGNYEFFTVRIGTYVVTGEKEGFAVAVADNVRVAVGARQRVDLSLQVGALTERVEVTGAVTRLETDTSQRGQVITGEETRALPLNGREYSQLALLSTGVRTSNIGTGSAATPREGSFNVNGLRSTFNNFLIDGVDNNAYGTSNQGFSNQVMQPPPDAVAEFRVVTNNMSAEYGRSGGATINVAYRSGTNQFHGSGWEFYRDTSLNAAGFFRPATGVKPPMERNQFGGVIGGPIIRNKAFFFADYEGFRQTRGLTANTTIANLTQRQGILSVTARNPFTGEVYPAGTPIPMTTFARKVLNDLPEPTNTRASNNYVSLQQFENVTDKFGAKVDVQASPSLSFFGRYGYRDVDIADDPPIPLPSGGAGNAFTYATNKQLASGLTYIPTSTSLLEVRFGWSHTLGGKDPWGIGTPSALEAYGITGLPDDPRVTGGLPTQLITGFSDLGRQATNPQWQFPTVYNPKVNYTWMLGRHSLKTGYEFQHIQTEVQDVNPLYGRDSYAGQFTRPAGAAASNLYNLADFMLGLRSTYALSNVLVANLRQNMHFTYLQDDFRVNDRLTLNLGLRYEYATPWVEKDDILSNFDPDTRQMVMARDGSLEDRSTIKPDRNNLGPRLGFAYTLTPRTVVRGGYGISYIHFHRAGGAGGRRSFSRAAATRRCAAARGPADGARKCRDVPAGHPHRGGEVPEPVFLCRAPAAEASRSAHGVSRAERLAFRGGDGAALHPPAAIALDAADSHRDQLRRVPDPGVALLAELLVQCRDGAQAAEDGVGGLQLAAERVLVPGGGAARQQLPLHLRRQGQPAGAARPTGQGTPAQVAEDMQCYRQEAGVEAFQINFNGCHSLDQLLASMDCFMQEVRPLVER